MTATAGYLGNFKRSKQTSPQAPCGRKRNAIALISDQTRSLTGIAAIRSSDASNATKANKVMATSMGDFVFKSFNQTAIVNQSITGANSQILSINSNIAAVASASAFFGLNPVTNNNTGGANVTTEVTGEGNSFKVVAGGFASVAGTFFVHAGETFSFEFSGYLQMNTSLQNAETQTANTAGRIAFGVYDVTRKPIRLDFLEVTSGLDTPGDRDFLNFQTSGNNISLNPQQTRFERQAGNLEESTFVSIVGKYKTQPFKRDTLLVLGDLALALKPPLAPYMYRKCQLTQNRIPFRSQKTRSQMGHVQPFNAVA